MTSSALVTSFAPCLIIARHPEELPTPVRAALTKPEQPETSSGQKIYATLSSDELRPVDDIVETPA